MRHWTFSAKLALALILMVVLTAVVGGMAAYWLRAVVTDKDGIAVSVMVEKGRQVTSQVLDVIGLHCGRAG